MVSGVTEEYLFRRSTLTIFRSWSYSNLHNWTCPVANNSELFLALSVS